MHISRAREQVMHQPVGQGSTFTSTQEFLPSRTDLASNAASQKHRVSDVDSGSNSLDWLPSYKKTTKDDSSKFFSSSASSSYPSSGDVRGIVSSEREVEMQSIPGLGDYNYPVKVQDKPVNSIEPSRPKYTSESAANILLHFGLEKEDLEHLISFPENQITPENLPYILRQIRLKKAKRDNVAPQPKLYLDSQPTPGMSGMDRLSSSRGVGMQQDEVSSSVLQPSKIIDYGHISKYTEVVGDEIGRTSGSRAHGGGSGSMSLMDTQNNSSHNREPLQKTVTEVRSAPLVSLRDQGDSVSCPSTSYPSVRNSLAPLSTDTTKRLQAQPTQAPHFSSLALPKKDTDLRQLTGISKVPASKDPEPDRQSTSKPKPTCTLVRGVHPGRPGLVLIGKSDDTHTKEQKRAGQTLKLDEQMRKQQAQQQQAKQPIQQQQQLKQPIQQQVKQPIQQQQQQVKQPIQQQQQQQAKQLVQQQQQPQSKQQIYQQQQPKQQVNQKQTKQQVQQQHRTQQHATQLQDNQQQAKQLAVQLQAKQQQATQLLQVHQHAQYGQALLSQYLSAKPAAPTSFVPGVMDPSRSVVHPLFVPPSTAQPSLSSLPMIPMGLLSSTQQQPPKEPTTKLLPTTALMHDYAAATPRTFPHTCSLCNKECTHMKVSRRPHSVFSP